MSLSSKDAEPLAQRYGLGGGAVLEGPVDQGWQGQVWRLRTDHGQWAVKESRAVLPTEQIEIAAAFQERAASLGVRSPTTLRATDGRLWTDGWGEPVRLYEWVDLAVPDRGLDPATVGRVLAGVHRAGEPLPTAVDPEVHPWFVEPVGRARWSELVAVCGAAGAPFTTALEGVVDAVVEVETLLELPRAADLALCHRDLFADNVRLLRSGEPVVIDWDNCGAASLSGELAMVLSEFGNEPATGRALVAAYVAAGGPARITGPADFAMPVAVISHIGELGCEQWLAATTDQGRASARSRIDEFCASPLTLPQVQEMVAAVVGLG